MNEMIKKPNHYMLFNGEKEVKDLIKDRLAMSDFPSNMVHLNYYYGNVVKYIMRCFSKGLVLQDLKKAREYLSYMIEELEDASR